MQVVLVSMLAAELSVIFYIFLTILMRHFLIGLFLVVSISSFSQIMTVRVTRVIDGDTFTCLYNGVLTNCRILNLDAPELGQPFGLISRDSLVKYLERKLVTIQLIQTTKKYDLYGRLLVYAWCPDNGVRIDVLFVRNGLAWYDAVNGRYPPSAVAQANAQIQRIGLWFCEDSGTLAVPPHLWRKMNAKQKILNRQTCW
jgi:micrococcal nuclease